MWLKLKQDLHERFAHWENIRWLGVIAGCIYIGLVADSRANFVLIDGVIMACFVGVGYAIYEICYNPVKQRLKEDKMVDARLATSQTAEASNVVDAPSQ